MASGFGLARRERHTDEGLPLHFWSAANGRAEREKTFQETGRKFGWHYLSNATCLLRPRLLYAFFVVSWINVMTVLLFATFKEHMS